MGNTLQNHPNGAHTNSPLQGNICDLPKQHQASIRCSLADNISNNPSKLNITNNTKSANNSRAHKSLDTKSKQKLSLSKQTQSQSSMRVDLKRNTSNQCRGIGLIQTEKSVSQHNRPSLVVSRSSPKIIISPAPDPRIIKNVIRPRDLPRRISTQKVIIFPQSAIKRVPLQPRIIINPPNSSPCIINYVQKSETLNNSHHSLQSSIVTPFIPPKLSAKSIQYLQKDPQPKKLKKVAMNRSHTNYNNFERYENNGQESEVNKQNEKKGKGQSLVQSKFCQEQKTQQLFTDPKLYAYITNKQHLCSKQIDKRYDLPISDDKFQTKRSNNFINKNPSQNKSRPSTTVPLKLQEAIPNEVQSRPFIQEDLCRFPTYTDFSQQCRTDNTSFIPIRNNSSQKNCLQGEELLKYCRPKIDSRVLADLQKLRFKI